MEILPELRGVRANWSSRKANRGGARRMCAPWEKRRLTREILARRPRRRRTGNPRGPLIHRDRALRLLRGREAEAGDTRNRDRVSELCFRTTS